MRVVLSGGSRGVHQYLVALSCPKFFNDSLGGGLRNVACCQNILFVCKMHLSASNIASVAYVLRVLLSKCYWSFLFLASC